MDAPGLIFNHSTGNDMTDRLTMRYRLEADPDVDSSYTPVTTTRTKFGITYPYFEVESMPAGFYVVHTYFNADGPTTGFKMAVSSEESFTV